MPLTPKPPTWQPTRRGSWNQISGSPPPFGTRKIVAWKLSEM